MKGLGNFINYFENDSFIDLKVAPRVGGIYLVLFQYPYLTKTFTFHNQTFYGICTAVRKPKKLMSSFTLRNVLNKDPIEFSFFLQTPLLRSLKFASNAKMKLYNKNKLYYLRNKKLGYSRL